MRYAMFDLEVTDPLSDLALSPSDDGVAVLVRRRGVPVGFWLEPIAGPGPVPAGDVARRICAEAGARILAAAIEDELIERDSRLEWPTLTIAICTKDRTDGVERLLQSLCEQAAALPEACPRPEILIVDNAPSDDRTEEVAARWPAVRYVREHPPGLNFGRNRALAEASGEILVFLDDDVTTDREWFAALQGVWAANRDAAAFTGQVLPMELETEAQILFEQRGGFRHGFDRVRFGPVSPGNRFYPGGAGMFGAGANMAFKVAVVRALGGFDEALDTGADVPGGGDLDIFYRVLRAGHSLVYEPRLLVFHQHRRTMDALSRQYRRSWGLGFMCYLTKCFQTDPARRAHLVHLVVWWFKSHARELVGQTRRRLLGRPHIPPAMLVGEIWGAVVGLLGGYGRSQQRIAKIRREFP